MKSNMHCNTAYRFKCTQTNNTRQNYQHFRRDAFRSYAQVLNSCAPLHFRRWWSTKGHRTQKLKQGKNNLSTTVNCNMLKLILITFSKMLIVFIISSLFLSHPVECIKCLHYIFQSKPTALHISVRP